MPRLTLHADRPTHRISRHIYGHFAEHLGNGIYGGIWVGDDSPIPNTRGIRNDVTAALRHIAIPNIRWPGGCFAETYHWRAGIGARERRPVTANCWSCGTIENNHFGTHEFFDLCEQTGAAPYICGNLGGGTVQEMSDWLAYITEPATRPLGRERAANGHLMPWSLKYWAIGNENWGCGGHMTPIHYAAEYRRYQTFCRYHSGTGKKLYKIACGYEDEWNDIILREAIDYIDGISIHHYSRLGNWGKNSDPTDFTFSSDGIDRGFTEREWWQVIRHAQNLSPFIERTKDILGRHDPAKRVGIIVDEWGAWYLEPADKPAGSILYQQNTMRDAIVAALSLNIFHQHADRIHMANIAQMINVLQAMIFTDGPRMILTPTYHVFEMYKVHHDAEYIPFNFSIPVIDINDHPTSALSATASRNASGKIHISLVNIHPGESTSLTCDLHAFLEPVSISSARILTSDSMDTCNTFAHPDSLAPRNFTDYRIDAQTSMLYLTLPARAVVTIAF